MAQTKTFIPTDFNVPDKFENQHFRLRMLTVNDVVKDYDAVMTSIDHLQGVFGPNSKWPGCVVLTPQIAGQNGNY